MNREELVKLVFERPLNEILGEYPVCMDFFMNLRLDHLDWTLSLHDALEQADDEILLDFGMDREMVLREFCEFLEAFGKGAEEKLAVNSVTVVGGHGKSGEPEISQWTVSAGEIVSIVGPTGAGKSRLLADIECLADGDTPTGRKILIDGRKPTEEERFELEGRLVAQLSQNMNFVMDLTVREFLEMHGGSRISGNAQEAVRRCFECANELAGEKFSWDVKVTQLSGGQSRALMIADTAYMSDSPIVLIDEIENAGIDRRQAVEILARKEKIVLISTHDPLLALGADKRIVIKNGGVDKIIETSEEEKGCLSAVEKMDETLYRLRKSIRRGDRISMEILER
ncbi:MAG TPA: ABC transporter ATP-binding protein [Bacillota bacterium]|nr:ABC transporter ATP-binding protein [Bacillota bacterium]